MVIVSIAQNQNANADAFYASINSKYLGHVKKNQFVYEWNIATYACYV